MTDAWAVRQLPYLASHQFSLRGLPPPLRQEVLYGLQQADPWLHIFEPCQVRRLARDLADTATLVGASTDKALCPHSTPAVLRMLNRVRTAVQTGFAHHNGTAPAQHDILDLRALGQRSRTPAGIRTPKTVDLRTIRQHWLRDLLRTWTVQQRPDADEFARTLRGVELASRALPVARAPTTPRPSITTTSPRPSKPSAPHPNSTANPPAHTTAPRSPATSSPCSTTAAAPRRSRTSLLRSSATPPRTASPSKKPTRMKSAKRSPNRSSANSTPTSTTSARGRPADAAPLATADLQLMYRTLYILLRDTGRRPNELVSLPRDCLETRGDQTSLIWHNHKGRRYRRRLPITTATAQAIRTWQARRDHLDPALPPAGTAHLFPALTPLATRRHLHTSYLSQTLRDWVDSIAHLHAEGTDPNGDPLPFDRTLIYAYAFRHSYAQRHADAGTPLDVLCELMDHKSVRTTQRYYNPRELHQTGEKTQVARSWRGLEGLRGYYELAA